MMAKSSCRATPQATGFQRIALRFVDSAHAIPIITAMPLSETSREAIPVASGMNVAIIGAFNHKQTLLGPTGRETCSNVARQQRS